MSDTKMTMVKEAVNPTAVGVFGTWVDRNTNAPNFNEAPVCTSYDSGTGAVLRAGSKKTIPL